MTSQTELPLLKIVKTGFQLGNLEMVFFISDFLKKCSLTKQSTSTFVNVLNVNCNQNVYYKFELMWNKTIDG